MTLLPNPAEEAERQMLIPAGRRAKSPRWSPEFLAAAIASGAIIEPATDRSPSASWARVLGVVGFIIACVAAASYPLWSR